LPISSRSVVPASSDYSSNMASATAEGTTSGSSIAPQDPRPLRRGRGSCVPVDEQRAAHLLFFKDCMAQNFRRPRYKLGNKHSVANLRVSLCVPLAIIDTDDFPLCGCPSRKHWAPRAASSSNSTQLKKLVPRIEGNSTVVTRRRT
jgi:hypothetical protein